ncbi:MAG TPA: hypothetical protein VHQ65_17230, partial [Thermoanaerobaculia bacterium]|nr:hypothetical protein [Thermoanaerobaculia bacterium]
MNRPNTLRLLRAGLLAGAVLLLMPSFAEAQFRGDMFFAQPSQAVAEDGTATFEVLLFAGADVVGATHFDVVFDPVLAEIVGVEAGTTEQLAPGHVAVTSPGRAAVVDLNATSLTQPIGTASLARITLRPLAPAGTRVPLSIQVRSVLRQDSGAVASRGFSGEMVVVSALESCRSTERTWIDSGTRVPASARPRRIATHPVRLC